MFLENNNPGLKADFHKKSKIYELHKCVVNVTPVTNPTQHINFNENVTKIPKSRLVRNLSEIRISRIFCYFGLISVIGDTVAPPVAPAPVAPQVLVAAPQTPPQIALPSGWEQL